MFCPNCNSILPNDAKFCSHCGAQLNTNNYVNSQPSAPSGMPNYQGFGSNQNNNAYHYTDGGTAHNGYSQNPYSNQYNNASSFNNQNTQNGYNPYGYNPNQNPNMYNKTYAQPGAEDKRSVGFGILSFFVPLLGLVLYLVWKDKLPEKAKGCGIAALVGFIFAVIRGILFAVFGDFDVYYSTPDVFDDIMGLSSLFISMF